MLNTLTFKINITLLISIHKFYAEIIRTLIFSVRNGFVKFIKRFQTLFIKKTVYCIFNKL